MPELWLKFKDEYGDFKRILVEQERFTIGRTPENDLGVPFNNISRQHAVIEQFDNTFMVSDCGSSNGTTLNDQNLSEAAPIENGDRLNVGGWLEIEIEIISNEPTADSASADGENLSDNAVGAREDESGKAQSAGATGNSSSVSKPAASSGSSSSWGWLLLAPVLVIFVLLIGGVILLASGVISGDKNNPPQKEPDISSSTNGKDDDDDDSPTPEKSKTPTPVETASPSTNPTVSTSPGGSSSPIPGATTPGSTSPTTPDVPATPKVSDDREKVKTSSALLLRRIATKDPNAFLTTQQAGFVTDKIKPFKGSSAVAENLKDAKKNSAKIIELAKSQNLTPQFLVVATLTELGTTRGDVVGKATEILSSLGDLSRVFSSEIADDSLLVIAATNQSKDGELLNTITKSGDEFPNSPVRSVWFLHDKNKLSPAQFDKVLRFLAIGTITQNPKDFSVNAEAVSF
jgi:cytoskeletal protein RodZ